MRTFSFGGGVQSTAVLVLAAQGKVQYDYFLFANVGDDSENPATLKYIEEYSYPFAKQHGLDLIELRKTKRDGNVYTLHQRIMTTPRSVPLPAWLPSGAFGNRTCTSDYKILVINKWQRQHGATKDNPCITGIGFSIDEALRMKDSRLPTQVLEYPLIDLRLSRRDCMKIISDAGLPVPPKSSCYFCPFHRHREWERLKREEPELFEKACQIDEHIRAKRGELGKDGMYLHVSRHPLRQAVGLQYAFDWNENDLPCDTGYCFV